MAITTSVSFNELKVGPLVSFLTALTTADLDKVVKISADHTVALCAAEDNFVGVLKTITDDAIAGVQDDGWITLTHSGTDPVVGYQELVANGSGGVKLAAVAGTGRKFFVSHVDETANTTTFKLY
jgi:hypothetical protein